MAKDDAGLGNGHPVREVVSRLEVMADRDEASLGELVGAFGSASFVPALMIPALLVISPLSGVPLFSSLCGITIALIAGQMLGRRKRLWLPQSLTRRSVSARRLGDAMRRTRRLADFIDRNTQAGRLGALLRFGGGRGPQALCMVAGLMMPLLELVPFSSSILGVSVLCFSISLLTRDGLFALFGLAVFAVAALIPVTVVSAV